MSIKIPLHRPFFIPGSQKSFHGSVFKGVIREDDEPPSGADETGGLEEDGVEGVHFAIDGDAEPLEDTGQDFGSFYGCEEGGGRTGKCVLFI